VSDHRALRVVRKMRDLLKAANTSAGQRVFLGDVSAIVLEEGAAIDLNLGGDSVLQVNSDNTMDSLLRVYADLFAGSAANSEKAIEQIFLMRTQAHVAFLADPTLGLTFGVTVRYQGTEELRDQNGGLITGQMRTVWDVWYRLGYTDPST
jgi:hypothetical protein